MNGTSADGWDSTTFDATSGNVLGFGARDAGVDILARLPPAGAHVPAQFLELVLRLLVEGADACVETGLHWPASALSTAPALRISSFGCGNATTSQPSLRR